MVDREESSEEKYNNHLRFLEFDFQKPRKQCQNKYNSLYFLQLLKFAEEFEPIFIGIIRLKSEDTLFRKNTRNREIAVDRIKRYSSLLKKMLGDEVDTNEIYSSMAIYDIWQGTHYTEHQNKERYTYLDVFKFYMEILKNILNTIERFMAVDNERSLSSNERKLEEILREVMNIANLETYFLKYIELANRDDLNILNDALNKAYEFGNRFVPELTEYGNNFNKFRSESNLNQYALNYILRHYNNRLGISYLYGSLNAGRDIEELPPWKFRTLISREYKTGGPPWRGGRKISISKKH